MNDPARHTSTGLLRCAALIAAIACTMHQAHGQQTAAIRYRVPYSSAKPAITSGFTSESSLAQRRHAVLKAAEVGYGSRAAGVLGNSVDVIATTPGGEGLALRMAVGNPAVRKGALRAARVAGALEGDPRFQVVALDQPVRDASGRLITDRDILYLHRATGALGRLEVKDVTTSSQRSNLRNYQRQIREMGLEQRKTGQQQAFVNRRSVIPELREYAEKYQVTVYENVVTSDRNAARQGTTPVTDVLNEIDARHRLSFRLRSSATGFGLLMAAREVPLALKAWQNYREGSGLLEEAEFRTLSTGAAGAFALSGSASTVASGMSPAGRWAGRLARVGRVANAAGWAFSAGALGVRGYQWYTGEISTRQMTTETVSAAGGIAGAWAGAVTGGWAGAKIGGAVALVAGPEAVPVGAAAGGFIGTVSGAIGGGWAVQKLVSTGVDSIYSRLDEQQQKILFAELLQFYERQSR